MRSPRMTPSPLNGERAGLRASPLCILEALHTLEHVVRRKILFELQWPTSPRPSPPSEGGEGVRFSLSAFRFPLSAFPQLLFPTGELFAHLGGAGGAGGGATGQGTRQVKDAGHIGIEVPVDAAQFGETQLIQRL